MPPSQFALNSKEVIDVNRNTYPLALKTLIANLVVTPSFAQPTDKDPKALAAKLTNPVADLISVPFQYNYDANIGLDKRALSTHSCFSP